MAPRWERAAEPPMLEGKVYLDTELHPYRSLSAQAFKLMLIAVIVVNAVVAIVFMAHGAAPVAGFCGLDVLALWVAFRMNYRSARALERVRLTPLAMHVERRDARGCARHWVLNPVWAQVREENVGVSVWSGGQALTIGSFLPPEQRSEFAQVLSTALYRAKRGV
jgi:uncharacterized membrane protein